MNQIILGSNFLEIEKFKLIIERHIKWANYHQTIKLCCFRPADVWFLFLASLRPGGASKSKDTFDENFPKIDSSQKEINEIRILLINVAD